ncbi:MAG: hypothetical protein V9G20_12865 [Candidatus Promineifilaceae bacterium]
MLYDDLGRLYHWTNNLPGESLTLYSSYDSLSRLAHVDASIDTFDQDYDYDAIGNLITRTGYINQVFNQVSFTRPHLPEGDANGTTYTYDANGNLTLREMQSGQVISYTYNAENYLTKVVSRTGTVSVITNYIYDGQGQRVKHVMPDGTSKVYLDSYFESEVSGSGQAIERINVSDSLPDSITPCLVQDTTGTPYFVWEEDSEIWFDSFGDVDPPINLSNSPTNLSDHPSLAVGANGTLHVIWRESPSGNNPIIYYRYYNGTSWGTIQTISYDYPMVA